MLSPPVRHLGQEKTAEVITAASKAMVTEENEAGAPKTCSHVGTQSNVSSIIQTMANPTDDRNIQGWPSSRHEG